MAEVKPALLSRGADRRRRLIAIGRVLSPTLAAAESLFLELVILVEAALVSFDLAAHEIFLALCGEVPGDRIRAAKERAPRYLRPRALGGDIGRQSVRITLLLLLY